MAADTSVPFNKLTDDLIGFDIFEDNPTVVVPLQATRTIALIDAHKVKLEVTSSNPSVARATMTPVLDGYFVAITASQPGHARLKFHPVGRPNEPIRDSLKVLVYAPLEVLVNVYLVTDGQGRKSTLSFAAVTARLKAINEFLTPQTGISLRPNLNVRFTVSADLNRRAKTVAEMWAVLDELNANANRYDPTLANISLYVVQRFGSRDSCANGTCKSDVRGMADPRSDTTGERRCIIEDDTSVKKYLIVLAHELLHTLGAEHDDNHGDAALMASRKGEEGRYIYHTTVRELRGLP